MIPMPTEPPDEAIAMFIPQSESKRFLIEIEFIENGISRKEIFEGFLRDEPISIKIEAVE